MRSASTVAWWELALNLKYQIVRHNFSAHIWFIRFKSSAARTVAVSSRSNASGTIGRSRARYC